MPARILLVDDEPSWRYSTAKSLIEAGYDVVAASDYMQALAQIGGEPKIDLLVTDVVMPKGMNGFALARMARLRQRDLKIIYVTAYDVPTDEAIGTIIRKPVDTASLLEAVKSTLAASAA